MDAIVIVGAGQAGARGAKALREHGYAGRITLLGDEGELPYERPLLSKALLRDPGGAIPHVLEPELYRALEIDVVTGARVEAIDRAARQVRIAGRSVRYDRLFLATGSRVRPLTVPGVEALSLRTLADSRAIAARAADRVAIVGGGFIGLEVAATLKTRGSSVVVIELAGQLLPRVGAAEVSAAVLAHHRARGIDVRLGVSVVGGRPGRLELSDGTTVGADLVVAGVGIVPNVELAAGLDVDDGVIVDADGRTSDPAIFAAGDVTRQQHPLLGRRVRLESWHNANQQAEAAARAILGRPPAPVEIPWVWSDQGDLALQLAGVPDAVDRVVTRHADGGTAFFQFHGRRLVGGITLNRGQDMTLIRRMLTSGFETDDFAAMADAAVPLRRLATNGR